MASTIKILHLYKDFYYSIESENKEESLTSYTNGVQEKNLEPNLDDFLKNEVFYGYLSCEKTTTCIGKGKYLFIQDVFSDFEKIKEAAQELYLEALWQELSFLDDIVYMRKLDENNITVFQLFRKIK